ncbi:MlaE family ABC transporter permease [Acidicapsa ligni]|uniref:MlaE family ABC transporter permease n=1 Tax=Acidicapsa ligni TaxID=542300 RepID=UPI0021E00D43|nr:ABC transporter permease [Acidicapsa ligni]
MATSPSIQMRTNPISAVLEWFGELGIFTAQVLKAAFTLPFEWSEFVRQLDEIGARSLPLVALAGSAIGVVLALETRYSLVRFGAKSLLPTTIVFAVVTEMSPIITGLVVSGRVGAGIGAELAAMKVTEQIDAIEASAVDPYKLLAVTRIAACILALPLLTLAASFCGVLMGWVTNTLIEPISLMRFINTGFNNASFKDFLPPTFKTCVFGLIIGLIACYQGMRARGGAEGVGTSATTSVVLSSLFVILADVVLVKLIILIFP